ncbi:MAG: serine/threonine protein kinase [Kiritimatiellae bacterium]|nr:serine/threonine protein kinase [Kiritimatiellia bacterium]
MAEFGPDDEIGAYRVVRLLGKGAMGAVYEVVHGQLGVHYALKSFTPKKGHVDVLKEKFLSEGRVLARQRHPNVIRVFDLDFDDATQTPYFVMDLVLGADGAPRTLSDAAGEGLEEETVRSWFTELASAIDYIHAQGIVHRDIKPGNVLLTDDGSVVLSDFGVSRLFSDSLRREVHAAATMVAEATGSRLVMGTHGCMAPEVARGEVATPAADVYSFALMSVYLLTGVWYEPGSRALELLETLELPWSQVLPQMLAEDPGKRPSELRALAKRLAPEARSGRRPARGWKAVAVVGCGLAAAISVCVAAWFAFRAPAPSAAEDDFAEAFSADGIFEVQK